MKNTLIIGCLLFFGFSEIVTAQEKKEIWYTWIDARVTIEGEKVRIVSDELMELTCCVSSARYQKFTAKTLKWLSRELNAETGEESPFAKTKDEALARQVLEGVLEKAREDPSIRIVKYQENCR